MWLFWARVWTEGQVSMCHHCRPSNMNFISVRWGFSLEKVIFASFEKLVKVGLWLRQMRFFSSTLTLSGSQARQILNFWHPWLSTRIEIVFTIHPIQSPLVQLCLLNPCRNHLLLECQTWRDFLRIENEFRRSATGETFADEIRARKICPENYFAGKSIEQSCSCGCEGLTIFSMKNESGDGFL